MPYSVLSVANRFLELAKAQKKTLTNMQLQKLVFLAQGYSLAILDRALFEEEIQAWKWGPVIPKLYGSLKKFGAGEVTEMIPDVTNCIPKNSQEDELIGAVWEAYKGHTGLELSAITHQDDSPWSQTRKGDRNELISNDLIKTYYRKSIDESAPADTAAATGAAAPA